MIGPWPPIWERNVAQAISALTKLRIPTWGSIETQVISSLTGLRPPKAAYRYAILWSTACTQVPRTILIVHVSLYWRCIIRALFADQFLDTRIVF